MSSKSLSFKIITSISVMVALILFSCVYCIVMINKTQTYAQDTATNWLPSIEAFGRINLQIGNLSRRAVLVIADAVAGQTERLAKNTEDLNKFKATLDKELNDYITNGLGPGEKPYYDETMSAYKEYIKTFEEEFAMIKEGKGLEALKP
ncbi:MCP four helix bundle domain-containing protein [Silvanigrella sp.]|jgi:methyl-accepting chemotaxis protein|uniref:MCP four helix bundle domain-containing protein n=1 Tax=Silvanigrella sp. TaxID=2024976 RepID=UPI0037C51A68